MINFYQITKPNQKIWIIHRKLIIIMRHQGDIGWKNTFFPKIFQKKTNLVDQSMIHFIQTTNPNQKNLIIQKIAYYN